MAQSISVVHPFRQFRVPIRFVSESGDFVNLRGVSGMEVSPFPKKTYKIFQEELFLIMDQWSVGLFSFSFSSASLYRETSVGL